MVLVALLTGALIRGRTERGLWLLGDTWLLLASRAQWEGPVTPSAGGFWRRLSENTMQAQHLMQRIPLKQQRPYLARLNG